MLDEIEYTELVEKKNEPSHIILQDNKRLRQKLKVVQEELEDLKLLKVLRKSKITAVVKELTDAPFVRCKDTIEKGMGKMKAYGKLAEELSKSISFARKQYIKWEEKKVEA